MTDNNNIINDSDNSIRSKDFNWIDSLDYISRDYFLDDQLGLLSPNTYFNHNFSPISISYQDKELPLELTTNVTINNNITPDISPSYASDSENTSLSHNIIDNNNVEETKRINIVRDNYNSDDDTDDDDIIRVSPSTVLFNTSNIDIINEQIISHDRLMSYIDEANKIRIPSKRPRGRKGLSEIATEILTQWIIENQMNPYPSQREKERLAAEAGLTVKQVVDWMTNMRKRRLHPIISGKKAPKTALDFMFLNNNSASYNHKF